jgi:hypothetical protein
MINRNCTKKNNLKYFLLFECTFLDKMKLPITFKINHILNDIIFSDIK